MAHKLNFAYKLVIYFIYKGVFEHLKFVSLNNACIWIAYTYMLFQ